MAGDGCLSRWSRSSRNSISYITMVTGHLQESTYYSYLVKLFEREFNVLPSVHPRKNTNSIVLRTYNLEVFACFKQLGFPVGKKNCVRIPHEIYSDTRLAVACVRGIFDTDGSVYERYRKQYSNHPRQYSYKVVQIKMKQEELLLQVRDILHSIGVRCNRLTKNGSCTVLRITHQPSIHWFFSFVMPSNTHHIKRYKNGSGGI